MMAPELKVDRLDEKEIRALRSLSTGTANEGQQKLALAVICNLFSRPHDHCYVPGDPNASSFLSGRAFVGQQILKHINVPIGTLIAKEMKDV